MSTSAADLRKWVRQRRLAEAREKAELRDHAPDPAQALSRGLGLVAFVEATSDAAKGADGGVSQEDLLAYERWARVRATLRAA
ncbi:MAG: hypothetical protein OXT09_02555 [Myxococcales bacterium]|nr:hypothetical protein [Myxococcales bacterium]